MTHTNLFWYLKNADLFQGLSARELREIAAHVHEKTCNKSELLYTPYSSNEDIYILKKGEVTLYTSKDGKKLVLDVLGPNSIFGALSPDAKNTAHFAEVTEEAYVCSMPLKKFSKLIGEKPQILMNLLKILTAQVADYQNKLKESLLSAEEKILACLEQHERRHNSILGLFSKSKLTHTKIADQTGLARETVSRILSRLKKEDLL